MLPILVNACHSQYLFLILPGHRNSVLFEGQSVTGIPLPAPVADLLSVTVFKMTISQVLD